MALKKIGEKKDLGFNEKTGEVHSVKKGKELKPAEWKKIISHVQGCNRDGVKLGQAIESIAEIYEVDKADVRLEIEKIYKEESAYHNFNNKYIVHQVQAVFKGSFPKLKRNILSGGIEIDGAQASSSDILTIYLDMKVNGLNINKDMFFDILCSDYTPGYHPIKNFFQEREKDSKYSAKENLIGKLASCISSNDPEEDYIFDPNYNEIFIRKWLVGSIASVYGYVNPLVLILAGKKQNTGKTQFFRRLIPVELKRFFTETKLDDMKEADLAMKMCESMYVFDDEMSGKSKQDQKRLKYLTSVDEFTIRKPYQRGIEKTKRLATLCGTSNDLSLLNDPTGNRRVIPIHVMSINHAEYNKIDKEALFMEAYFLFRESEKESSYNWELKQSDIDFLAANTFGFEAIDRDAELILRCFEVPLDSDMEYRELTCSEIASYIEVTTKYRPLPAVIGVKLQKMGFPQRKTNKNNISMRLYRVKFRDLSTDIITKNEIKTEKIESNDTPF